MKNCTRKNYIYIIYTHDNAPSKTSPKSVQKFGGLDSDLLDFGSYLCRCQRFANAAVAAGSKKGLAPVLQELGHSAFST